MASSALEVDRFDLLLNPFVVLSISPSASKEELAEAFEDRLAEGADDEKILRDARRVLLVPNSRLLAELAYLIDTPAKTAEVTLERIRQASVPTEALAVARGLPPLSRLNVIGHLATKSSDKELLISYIDAQSEVTASSLENSFKKVREAAGMPKPTLEAIELGLQQVIDQHCQSMVGSYQDNARAADDVQKCVEYFLRSSDADDRDSLSPLLKAYRRHIVPEQTKYSLLVDQALGSIKEQPDDISAHETLSNALKKWDRLSQPLQVFEEHIGRDDPESRDMFNKIRRLSLELANDHDRFDIAQKLSKLSLEVFAELPRAVEQLKEDLATLDERVLASTATPLVQMIETIEGAHRRLAVALKAKGFTRGAPGMAGELFAVFQEVLEKLSHSGSSDLPWAMLRGLTLDLNNDLSDPRSSLAIIEGMVDHPLFSSASETLRMQIKEDELAVRENVLELELADAASSKNFVAAQEIAERLFGLARDPAKKVQYSQILEGLRRRNSKKSGKWIYAVVAVVGLVAFVSFLNEKPKSSYRPPAREASTDTSNKPYQPSTQKPTVPADTGTVIKPPPGQNNTLAIEGVRYCKFESERLSIIEPQVTTYDTQSVIDSFNADVSDFNARCGAYEYYVQDMEKVKAELLSRASFIRQEASNRLQGWRSAAAVKAANEAHLAPEPQSSPSVAPTSPHSAKLNLLNIDDAIMVQSVLADLGYFEGAANGTWGQKSRRALRLFKQANGLANDDGFDGSTEVALFGSDAVSFTPDMAVEAGDAGNFSYPAPFGASLNPLNPSDAVAINGKLRDLGLYTGKQLDVWSGLSREALSSFRLSRGLPNDNAWDWQVEKQLFEIQ